MKLWWILTIIALSTACQPQTTSTAVPVEFTILAPITPSTTPDCLHANGVVLNIKPLSRFRIELHVSGLLPGEKPSVLYSTSKQGRSMRGEIYNFAQGADEHGELTFDIPGLRPLEGQTNAIWDIRIVHARGVECASITLP